jgi:hypothetical protein
VASFSRIAAYVVAGLPAAIGVAFVARYGYATSDTVSDGIANAFIFGMLAAGAFTCPAFATIAGRNKHHLWSFFLGVLAVTAIVANWSHTLGAVAGRGAVREASNRKAVDDEKDARTQLARLDARRNAMQFTPMTANGVEAARQAASTAERNRISECGANNEKRGRLCRDKENEEQTKRDALAIAMTNKDATDQASKLDAEASAIRAKVGKSQGVTTENSLGQALGRILSMDAARAATMQQGLVAAIVELLIAAALVLPEVLRRDLPRQPAPRADAIRGSRNDRSQEIETSPAPIERTIELPSQVIEHQPEPMARSIAGVQLSRPMLPAADVDTVGRCMLACLKREEGTETTASAIFARYQRWCEEQGLAPLPMQAFAEQFAQRCKRAGIKTRRSESKVYCVNIALSA